MSHKLVWRPTDRVLTLTLTGEISLMDFVTVSDDIDVMLGSVTEPLVLIVDAENVRLSRSGLSQARTTPTYMESRLVEHLLIVASDKIIRLTLLVVFNLNRPVLRFFDHMDQAEYYLRTAVRRSLH